jgi:LmbE family N-acetylglucosaminyl deacetylase
VATAVVSLTRGEAGQIRDVKLATRRTLGRVRCAELLASARALGVDRATCFDLGDGHLAERFSDAVRTVRRVLTELDPDIVVTFGPDGAFGHPDHVVSCLATLEVVRTMEHPPRVVHARFPPREQLLVDELVAWLTSTGTRFAGTAAFGHALKLFADGSTMLGFAADHLAVEWFPAASFVVEQGEPASELFCILSGSVDVVHERPDGTMEPLAIFGAGSFFGEDGLASGQPRNAHVVAREDVTCLVLAAQPVSRSAGRGAGATGHDGGPVAEVSDRPPQDWFTVDVTPVLDQKVAALAAHRSQYAMDEDLLPRSMLARLLGQEHFVVAEVGDESRGERVCQ